MLQLMKKFVSIVCCGVLLVGFLCPTEVFAQEYNSYLAEKDSKLILKYARYDVDGLVIFDSETAKAEGMTEDIIKSGEMFETLSNAYNTFDKARMEGISLYVNIPIYGNYCGPGTESNAGAPIDYLDAKCEEHDDCYASKGYYACECDQDLVDAIDAKYSLMSGDQKTAAAAIRTYFSLALDNPTEKGGSVMDGHLVPSCATNP